MSAATDTLLPIAAIKINGRHRKNLGNVGALAESIERVGLLHPPVVDPDNYLIAGERRLAALRFLGREEVSIRIAWNITDAQTALMAERDENECREDMKPSEKAALGIALEELERPKAEARMKAGTVDPGKTFPRGVRGPKTADIVGEAVGMSAPTYNRAKAVLLASEDESLSEEIRRIAEEAREEMDRTGKVTPAYNRVAAATGRKPTHPTSEAPKANGGRPADAAKTKTYKGRRSAHESAEKAIGMMAGLASGFREFNIAKIDPTPEERSAWEQELSEVVSAVNHFRRHLRGSYG